MTRYDDEPADQENTLGSVLSAAPEAGPSRRVTRLTAAPGPARRTVVVSAAMFVVLVAAQVVALSGIVTSMLTTIESGDIAGLLESSSERSAAVRFASGFSLSIAATLGTLALVGGLRLLVPYRNGSLRLIQYCTAGQLLIVAANLVGLALGNRPLDATTIGTVLSLVYSVPVLVLSSHRVVRAWSVRFTPPPPPLPN